MKTFATDLCFCNFLLDVEGRKCLLQKMFSNHRTFFSWLLKNSFLTTSFLRKCKYFFFNIFNLNPTVVVTREPRHLLNTTDVTTCRNGVKTYQQNAKWPYIPIKSFRRTFIFHNPRLSMKRSHYFILRSFLAILFISLTNVQVSTLAPLVKSRQNQSVNKRFCEDVSQ